MLLCTMARCYSCGLTVSLCEGDRRASGTGGKSIQAYNIEETYGMKALKELMQTVGYGAQLSQAKSVPEFIVDAFPGESPSESMNKFLEEAAEHLDAAGFSQGQFSKSKTKLRSFLNRVLGIKLSMQNLIFRSDIAQRLTFVFAAPLFLVQKAGRHRAVSLGRCYKFRTSKKFSGRVHYRRPIQ